MNPIMAMAVSLALSDARAAIGAAAHAMPRLRAEAPPSDAAPDEQAYRIIRAAEVAGDVETLDAWSKARAGARIDARVELAREAIRLRTAAKTVAEAVAAEREIERLRGAMLAKIASDAPRAARELALESAEDLLLRDLTLGARDALVAIGLPSELELREAETVRAAADARLSSDLLAEAFAEDAAIATDAAVFRAHALRGLARVVAADVAQLRGDAAAIARAQDDARRLLARASQCELPVPKALGDVLALARSRIERDAAVRDRLLARAAESEDPVSAFVARVALWRHAGMRGPFPAIPSAPEARPVTELLARVACTAELRARATTSDDGAALAAPVAQLLARADGAPRMRGALEWLAERMPDAIRLRAMRDDAPAELFAVAALSKDGDRAIDVAPAAVARAIRDPRIGPLVVLRVAERLAARGEASASADMILEGVRAFPSLSAARPAMAIALDIRRALGDEVRLDATLLLALERFTDDHDAAGWLFERIDLALHGSPAIADLEHAAELLRTADARDRNDALRDDIALRELEIAYARIHAETRPAGKANGDALAARLAELERLASDLEVAALADARAPEAPIHRRAMSARLAAVRAAIALAREVPPKACLLAERALADPAVDDRTALRAARSWIEGAIASDESLRAPPSLRAFAARSPEFRAWVVEPIARLVEETEAALAAATPPRSRPAAIEDLADLAAAGAEPQRAECLRARAIARLSALDRAEAERCARAALRLDPLDRLAAWILAESLRGRPAGSPESATDEARSEAFALYRSLAPMNATERDRFWWRGQLAQLEMLLEMLPEMLPEGSDRDRHGAEIVARVNRLSMLDPSLGGSALARRFESLRKEALASGGVGADGRARERRRATGPSKDSSSSSIDQEHRERPRP